MQFYTNQYKEILKPLKGNPKRNWFNAHFNIL